MAKFSITEDCAKLFSSAFQYIYFIVLAQIDIDPRILLANYHVLPKIVQDKPPEVYELFYLKLFLN
jgi:hypothetical protein